MRIVKESLAQVLTVLVRDSKKLEQSPLPFHVIVVVPDRRRVAGEGGGEGSVGVGRERLRRESRSSGRKIESETNLVDAESRKREVGELGEV